MRDKLLFELAPWQLAIFGNENLEDIISLNILQITYSLLPDP